jgi:hypothetical protein
MRPGPHTRRTVSKPSKTRPRKAGPIANSQYTSKPENGFVLQKHSSAPVQIHPVEKPNWLRFENPGNRDLTPPRNWFQPNAQRSDLNSGDERK